jgi:hypothetical protein
MTTDFTPNFHQPSPVINDVVGTIEDVAGDMTTSKTLLGSLIGEIENMQGLARQMKQQPDSVSPDAVAGRLDDLWALGEAIDQRLRQNLVLLYAIVNKRNAEQA